MSKDHHHPSGQETIDLIRSRVEKGGGWFLVAAYPPANSTGIHYQGGEIPFFYSVGIASEGYPEIAISGSIDPEVAFEIAEGMLEKLKAGEFSYESLPEEGLRAADLVGDDYDVLLKRVTADKTPIYLTWAAQYQIAEGREVSDLKAIQVVLPDPENRLPGDPGFEFNPPQETLWE